MRKRSALKWVAVPTPAEAKLKEPGLALAVATRSCAVLKPFDGETTNTFGLVPSETAAAKSAAVSYGGGQQRIAVRLRLGDHGASDRRSGAAAVLDHDRLPELRR